MMKSTIILALVLILAGCLSERSAIVTKESVSVFEAEYDAAYEGSLNKEIAKPISVLAKGDRVSVLKDTYGKDYWACKIKLENKISGWVLCTKLAFQKDG